MTEYPLKFHHEKSILRSNGRHKLDELDYSKYSKRLTLFRPDPGDIDRLVDMARGTIPGLTTNEIVRKVVKHNPDCLWAIAHKTDKNAEAPVGEGFVAMLPLTIRGLHMLATDMLNTRDPDLTMIARPGERPAGLYMWATYAPGGLAGGICLFMKEVAEAPYDGVNLYSCPNTPAGVRYNEALGLQKCPKIGPVMASHLYEFVRTRQKLPLYDSYKSKTEGQAQAISVAVVRTFEDMMRMVSIRSAVYIAEQECPYLEEFDGNDMSSTHLLGYIGDEPAGCIRIRYFADFAKIERLAVRKEFRNSRLSFKLVNAAIELCQMKGYRRLYGHAQNRLINFWSRFGFKKLEGGRDLVFSDFDYTEMVADVMPHPEAISIGVDPYKILRPEGQWHRPGVLESSISRDVSRPSIGVH